MKLYRKDFNVFRDLITIIPTIEIQIDQMQYTRHNVQIAFHWLVFHARLLFMEEGE